MDNQAKIRLSSLEMELVSNSDWILTKNGIIQKVKYLLEDLQAKQQLLLDAYAGVLPAEVINIPPKISRGENYKGLPWLILDYPRYFEKDNHFAIRSMFWWGQFFSITLHLSGAHKEKYGAGIRQAFNRLQQDNFYICINNEEWEHHFEAGNYRSLKDIDQAAFKKHLDDKPFLKLAKNFSLEEWDNAGPVFLNCFSEILEMIAGKNDRDI